MIRNLLASLVSIIIIGTAAYAQTGQGALQGKVLDKETGEPLPFVNVAVELNGVLVTGGVSDIDGKYVVKPVPPGKYTVKASSVGYNDVQINGVVVNTDAIRFVDIKMASAMTQLGVVDVVEYKVPLIEKDNTADKTTITQEDLLKMPARSAAQLAQTTGGTFSQDDGSGSFNARGARDDANVYFIDGMRITGSSAIPKAAMEQVSVILAGVPAQYGDFTGGIVSITTKGPSSKYYGSVEVLSSGFKSGNEAVGLDAFGENRVEASISGPLLMRKDSTGKKTTPIIGFFVGALYNDRVDPRPSAIGVWKVKDDALDELRANPVLISPIGQGVASAAEFYRLDQFEKVRTRQNVHSRALTLNGKLDFNTGKNTNLTFGGTLDQIRRREFRGGGTGYDMSLYSYDNNPRREDLDWRVFGRFTQRFGSNNSDNSSTISNAYYTVQVDYNQDNFRREDPNHGDNFWNYGYVGQFRRFQERQYAPHIPAFNGPIYLGDELGWDSNSTNVYIKQQTFADTLIGFERSSINPYLSQYTQGYYDFAGWQGYDENGNPIVDANTNTDILQNLDEIRNGGGLINGDQVNDIYTVWRSHAWEQNSFIKSRAEQVRVSIMGSADVKNHSISLGFEFEQRTIRNYSMTPRALWTIGNQRANSHISNLDELNPTIDTLGSFLQLSYERLNASPGDYQGEIGADAQSYFDYNLRKSLGLDPDGTDFIDFHSLSPDQLDISFFSTNELLNNGRRLVDYYGYDAYGNRQSGSPSLDDFFNQTNEDGVFTRPQDAFRPNYIAGWIQDKFAYDDLVFNVGVRVDRLDLNQSVLVDPYVLFPTVRAGEEEARNLAAEMEGGYQVPGNIGDNYVVYVDNVQSPTRITGYRNGDTWYSAEGAEVSDASTIRSNGQAIPLLQDKDQTTSNQLTSASFVDYDPQINFMPRISFSFPISEEALFYAHYDVLTRRPTDRGSQTVARLDLYEYYYLDQQSGDFIANNPNLRPERVIDYSIGFKQKVTNSAAISIEAFYREFRDQIQLIGVQDAFPRQYFTFGNIDFATIKGLIFKFDLRRTQNLTLRFAYTLQFAEGTGSNSFSALNLVRSGKTSLRSTVPLGYDQRHTIVATLDYRYGSGKAYNGPRIFDDVKILEGVGANLQFNVGSGTPYSRQTEATGNALISGGGTPLLLGTVNGSRLPWQFSIDMRVDKDILLNKDGKKPLKLNVYLQMFNVLNSLNINTVYRYTGTPNDDGYLTSPIWQNDIENQLDSQAFREQYSMAVNDYRFYNLPRRTQIGALLIF
jgi:hypothetical protein